MGRLMGIFLLCAGALRAQTNTGELRVKVSDPSGAAVRAGIVLTSEGNDYRNALSTNEVGYLSVQRMPFGIYRLEVHREGFAEFSQQVEIRSRIAIEVDVKLALPSVSESVTVSGDTLINPDQAGAVNQIGTQDIQTRLSSLPGRSLQDLVNTQPGWLYEGNAVLPAVRNIRRSLCWMEFR
jgi:hypothetical protein